MTVRRWIWLLSFACLCSAAVPAAAEDALAAQDRRDYEAVKTQRDRLVNDLQALWKEIDGPTPGETRADRLAALSTKELKMAVMEAELSVLLARARELRRDLLEAKLRTDSDDGKGVLSGRWRLTIESMAGDLDLVQVGAFLSGSWSLPGTSGGTFIGHGGRGRALVMLIDDRGDLFATLRGSASDRSMEGTYLRTDLSSGQPAQGQFSANRIGR